VSCIFYSNNFSTQTNDGYSTKRVSAITVPSSLTQFTCMVQWPSVYIRLETEFLKLRVFWDVLPCSQIDVDRRFRGACCLHHQGDPGPPEYGTRVLTRPRRSIPALKMETICSSETFVSTYESTRDKTQNNKTNKNSFGNGTGQHN
jgi:hypothetical protein